MEFLTRIRLRRKRPNQNPNFHLTNNNNINININAEEEMEETITINNANKSNDSFTDRNIEEMEEEEKTSEGTSSSSSTTTTEKEEEEEEEDFSSCSVVGEMKKKKRSSTDTPPTDDCCPICFGSFTVACRASCGHWYCGACILQYWNYGAALQPCKCPMCFRQITWLRPEASLYHLQEVEVTDVLKKVQKYNRLFVGGTYGLFLRVLELPFFMKRVFRGLMDPDRVFGYHNKLRLFAVFLGALYTISPFDFLPTGRMMSAIDIFDYSAIALSFILYFVGLYLRRRRLQNARHLAVIQP